jgi:hypothetical protein
MKWRKSRIAGYGCCSGWSLIPMMRPGARPAAWRFLMNKTNAITVCFLLALNASACSTTGSSTSSATVSAIALSPDPCALGRTKTQQMAATATLNDGTKENISNAPGAAWSSANDQTATVSSQGVVVGVNAGVTSITIGFQGATGSLDCTIGP